MCRRIFQRGSRGRSCWRFGLPTLKVSRSASETCFSSSNSFQLTHIHLFIFTRSAPLVTDAQKFHDAFEAAKRHNVAEHGGELATSGAQKEESSDSDSDSGSDSEKEAEKTEEKPAEEEKEEKKEEEKKQDA